MKTAIWIATGALVLAAGTTVRADEQKYDRQFCDAAAEYRTNVAELKAIGPHSTVAELRSAVDRLNKPINEMQKSAHKMKTPAGQTFNDAVNQLKHDANNVPDDATLAQVQQRIRSDAQNAEKAGRQVASEAGCPAPPPPSDQK
jgi:hypothetical protein